MHSPVWRAVSGVASEELGELGSRSWLLVGRRNASWEGSVPALVSFSTPGADYGPLSAKSPLDDGAGHGRYDCEHHESHVAGECPRTASNHLVHRPPESNQFDGIQPDMTWSASVSAAMAPETKQIGPRMIRRTIPRMIRSGWDESLIVLSLGLFEAKVASLADARARPRSIPAVAPLDLVRFGYLRPKVMTWIAHLNIG